ncbi:hypothetical protein U1Q18_035764 [Sarracenia purpurea var. burkii]
MAVSDGGGVSGDASTRCLSEMSSEEETLSNLGVDLVAAARRNLGFLRIVADSHWLHHKPTLLESIRRYDELWMPMISDLSVGPTPPMVLPPIDIEWVWFCHTLNPASYKKYCESRFSKLVGKPAIFDAENEEFSITRCRDIWIRRYQSEPFENEVVSSSSSNDDDDSSPSVTTQDLLGQVLNQRNLYAKLAEPYMFETVYLIAARKRYRRFLHMIQKFSDGYSRLVPASDIQLMWIIHQSYPTVYTADVKQMEGDMGKVATVWEAVQDEDVEETKKLWERAFDQPYEKAGGAAYIAAAKVKPPPVYWEVVDDDVNARYKSLKPRFLLELDDSKMKLMQGKSSLEFMRLRMVRCHRELKIDNQISSFRSDSWQKAWHLYCEFGTRGVVLALRHRGGGRFFKGSTVRETMPFLWNDLLRANYLTLGREFGGRTRVMSSITPPVQASYLLKCVPDRVTDDSGAMISDVILRMNQYRPQEGRWLSRTVLDHAGRECFVVRIR